MMSTELDRYLGEMADDFKQRKKFRTGWQQSGTLTVGGGTSVTMQTDFGDADTFTVGFLQPYAQTGTGDDIGMRAEALIMWNVEGSYKPVRVSLVGGMSVTAAARGVKIIMTDATPQDAANDQPYAPLGTQYQVSALVAKGSRGSSQNPPYYIPKSLATALVVPNGNTAAINVPTDAGIQSLLVLVTNSDDSAAAAGDCTVLQYAGSKLNPSVSTQAISRFDPHAVSAAWIPIVPGCTVLKFKNNTASKTQEINVFLGVDG